MSEREAVEEHLTLPLRQARDHAHWLAVHRKGLHNGLATHLEQTIDTALRMAYDLSGQVARAERAKEEALNGR